MPYKLTRVEAPMRLSLALNEAINQHDVEAIMALLEPDCVVEHYAPAPDGTLLRGSDAVRAFWEDVFRDSPQLQRRIIDTGGLGRTCILHWRLEGIEAASGYLLGIDVIEVRDQLIAKIRSYVKG